DDQLRGQGSITSRTEYYFIDEVVIPGKEYFYILSDVSSDPADQSQPVTRHTDRIVKAVPKAANDVVYPLGFRLATVYPNPFNPSTTISFNAEADQARSPYTMSIVDMTGRVIWVTDGIGIAGQNDIVWNGRNGAGSEVTSGVYFAILKIAGTIQTAKLTLLR
ncbi:MAG: T9SS type A sorting domain-containing protein, partial [Planctomycetes bacterium]|nr:T9SS type A sorting domain-containing protein [Planctomycetota bacterium]